MSSNIVGDLSKGVSRFSTAWKWLLRICLLGWFSATVAGLTGLMAVWWFAAWVIPLSTVLCVKAALSYFESEEESVGVR